MSGIEDTIKTYHAIFAPYFSEYRELPRNCYDVQKSTDTREMIRAAQDHGLNVSAPSLPSRRMMISDGNRKVGFAAAQPSRMKPVLTAFCDDKLIQKEFYKNNHIPHARGHEVLSLENALESRRKLGSSVVIKPSRGRQGIGVTVDIRDDDALVCAWNLAHKERAQSAIMIEETFVGCDVRAFILNKEVICAYLKIPPNVVGDGVSSVEELVRKKNIQRSASPALGVAMIKTDQRAIDLVARQGLDLSSVPANNQVVLMGLTQSVSSGGDLLPITGRLAQPILDTAYSVARAMEYDGPLGMDVLCRDFEEPHGTAIICETNPQPAMFGALYPPVGAPVDCPKKIIQHYFGETSRVAHSQTHSISSSGATEEELAEFCKSYKPQSTGEPSLSKGSGKTIKFIGTENELSVFLGDLLNSNKAPRFVDSAYVARPEINQITAAPAFPIRAPAALKRYPDKLLSDVIRADGYSLHKAGLGNVYSANKRTKEFLLSTQLNGWYANSLCAPMGYERLRHQLAVSGVKMTPALLLNPNSIRSAKRYVARSEKSCTLSIWAGRWEQFSERVSTATEVTSKLQAHVNSRTKKVILKREIDCPVFDLLVFDGKLISVSSSSGLPNNLLHPKWQQVVQRCVDVLPGARLVTISIAITSPELEPGGQEWAVDGISTMPNLGQFGAEICNPKGQFALALKTAMLSDAIESELPEPTV